MMPVVMNKMKSRYVILAAFLSVTATQGAHAQVILDPSTWFSATPEGDKQRDQELKQAGQSRGYKPAQFGLWLVESGATAGAVYDSNLYSSRVNAISATGVSFSPSFVGRYTDGGQNATAYLSGNFRRFSTSGELTTFSGRFGIGNSLEIQRGTIWKALVQLSRSQDDGSAYNATGLGADASGVYVKPINSNGLFAATSILSRIDYAQFSGFWSGGLSTNLTRFEDAELSNGSKISQSSRDTNSYTATGRLGWNLAPTLYTFIEPSLIMQKSPDVTNSDTTTYRFTAGLGTDRINLMRGEVFAGYARQKFDDLSSQAQDGFVYGGRVNWFPTRDLTFTLTGDDSIGVTASGSLGAAKVYSSRTKTVSADLSYALDQRINLAVRSSYSNVDYSDTGRKDDILRAGADMTYMVSDNFGLRLGYSNIHVQSTSDLDQVDRNIYTVGINGRF